MSINNLVSIALKNKYSLRLFALKRTLSELPVFAPHTQIINIYCHVGETSFNQNNKTCLQSMPRQQLGLLCMFAAPQLKVKAAAAVQHERLGVL